MRQEHKPNVLIVDNDDRILWEFQELLENAGFNTQTTWSGREALAMMQSGNFGILLVDEYLPDVHSHDFLERVTRLALQPSIVVMHSAKPSHDDLKLYSSLGVSDVVDKRDPFTVRQAVSACCEVQPLVRKTVH